MSLFEELKRRNVIRVAIAYAVIAWVLMQVGNILFTTLELGSEPAKILLAILLLGFIPAVIFAWAFEITPEGIKKEKDVIRDDSITNITAKKLDYITLAAAFVVIALFIYQQVNPVKQSELNQKPVLAVVGTDLQADIEKSIAVLPFVNMSSDKEQEYFSDGITEEILNALAKVKELKVVGRTSSFSFKGKNQDMRVIGDALGVAHLLEGSVRKAGERVRITAQLIQVDNGFHLWSETYDDSLEDIFEVQEKISRAIASELKVLLNVGDAQRLAKRLTDNQQAYDLFLQGRELGMTMYGQETLPKAVKLLEQAVELDPDFAEAWSWLAFSNFMLPQQVQVKDEKPYIDAAVKAAIKSNKLDPELSAGYSILGSKHFLERDYVGGFELVNQAYEIEPNDPMNIFNQGYYRSFIGQTKAAPPFLKKAVDLDPVGGGWIHNYAHTLMADGQLKEAEQMARRSFDSGFTVATMAVAQSLVQQGDLSSALDYLNTHYDDMKSFSAHFQQREVWDLTLKAIYEREPAAQQMISGYISQFMQSPDFRPDISSVGSFHLVDKPEKFMQAFEQYKFAGATFVLSRIWDERPGSKMLRQHPDFPAFAERIGLVDVWEKMGWPDKCQPIPVTAESTDAFVCD